MNFICQAMMWKYGAKCSKTKDKSYIDLWEHPTLPKPSKEQMEKDIEEYRQYLFSTEYQRKRKLEYPSIGDQLDALWKGGEAQIEMKAKIDAIKTKHPKPE